MEYYLTINIYEVLINTTTWMYLGNIMLNERNKTPDIAWPNLYEMSTTGKSIETESRLASGCQDWRGEGN